MLSTLEPWCVCVFLSDLSSSPHCAATTVQYGGGGGPRQQVRRVVRAPGRGAAEVQALTPGLESAPRFQKFTNLMKEKFTFNLKPEFSELLRHLHNGDRPVPARGDPRRRLGEAPPLI